MRRVRQNSRVGSDLLDNQCDGCVMDEEKQPVYEASAGGWTEDGSKGEGGSERGKRMRGRGGERERRARSAFVLDDPTETDRRRVIQDDTIHLPLSADKTAIPVRCTQGRVDTRRVHSSPCPSARLAIRPDPTSSADQVPSPSAAVSPDQIPAYADRTRTGSSTRERPPPPPSTAAGHATRRAGAGGGRKDELLWQHPARLHDPAFVWKDGHLCFG